MYLLDSIANYVHIDTHDKESMTPMFRRPRLIQLCLIYLYIDVIRDLLDGIYFFAPQINVDSPYRCMQLRDTLFK